MTFYKRLLGIVFFNLLLGSSLHAEETDQFTLPPHNLHNIGSFVSQRAAGELTKIMQDTNEKILRLLPKAPHNRFAQAKLALYQSDIYLADAFYNRTGPGFPRWLHRNSVRGETMAPIQHKELWPWNTVYWLVFMQSPFALIGIAPTISMYGHNFGTDKLGHFFMQGHTYFKINKYWQSLGKSAPQAHDIMVAYGRLIENTYLGTLVNGVYSNGDLSANYAGWKFYTNIANPITIGNKTLSPMIIFNGITWEWRPSINKDTLLEPFISDNLNEAYNPSRYLFMKGQLRRNVMKRCDRWINEQGLNLAKVNAKLQETRLWHGEEYGHSLAVNNAVTLRVCFRE